MAKVRSVQRKIRYRKTRKIVELKARMEKYDINIIKSISNISREDIDNSKIRQNRIIKRNRHLLNI